MPSTRTIKDPRFKRLNRVYKDKIVVVSTARHSYKSPIHFMGTITVRWESHLAPPAGRTSEQGREETQTLHFIAKS